MSADHRCSRGCGCTVEERFWSKVERRGFNECWPWKACVLEKTGYGRFGVRPGQLGLDKVTQVLAHRVAFFFVHGRWPEPQGLHGCDNPPCCNAENPEHVHEGTQLQNVRECIGRGRAVLLCNPPGAAHPAARLSAAQVAEIRLCHDMPPELLAVEFGVSERTIRRVVARETYRE